ncbi:protein tyrosine kinase [Fragilaria crotonensis]|nr:protein tyrosine kinase [Fragilaria crotonensis]
MGAKQSALTLSPSTATTHKKGLKLTMNMMTRTINIVACVPLANWPYAKLKSSISDPMGTQILTPVHERRKRERFSEAVRNSPGEHNGRQGGLEKENSSQGLYSRDLLIPNSNFAAAAAAPSPSQPPQHQPQVYEGKDAERLLNAKYELLEVLGVGATSTVHRCTDRKTFRDYACKIVDKRHISESFHGMMDQFHTEIQALKSLRHDNIIQLYDVFISDEKIFIVMELMYGGELFDYVVQKGTLTEEEASAIVRKVTSAIVYMHSKNIIHRDLKPENLLLHHRPKTPMDLEVKIIDFGLSKCMIEPVTSVSWEHEGAASDALLRARFVLRFPRWAKNLSASAKDLLSKLLDVTPGSRYTAEALRHPWVTGETAPSDNVLESPGRIKKSPAARKHRRDNSRDYNAVQHQHHNQGTLVAPKRHLVRKTSI